MKKAHCDYVESIPIQHIVVISHVRRVEIIYIVIQEIKYSVVTSYVM